MADNSKLDLVDSKAPVPAFTCLVYVSHDADKVSARVANLEGIEASGSSEREVLGKIVPAFRGRVAELIKSREEIPWMEPPTAIKDGEQKRIIPVHL